jgi:GxxExxY protein
MIIVRKLREKWFERERSDDAPAVWRVTFRHGHNCFTAEAQRRRGAENFAEDDVRDLNELSGTIVDAAIRVHSALGPGLLESAYETCLAYELRERGLTVRTQVALPVVYKTITMDVAYRIDLLVEECLIVEIKTVPKLLPIHEAQLLTYLRLIGHRIGLLLNFHVPLMREGIKRMVNSL